MLGLISVRVNVICRMKGVINVKRMITLKSPQDHFFHIFANEDERSKDLYKLAWPNQWQPPINLKPALYYKEDMELKSVPPKRARLASLHLFCDALIMKEDAETLPFFLKRYSAQGTSTHERTASCIIKAVCRANVPEVGFEILNNQHVYRIQPTLRAMNFLMYRFLIDSEANPEKAKFVQDLHSLFPAYRLTSDAVTSDLLFHSLLIPISQDDKFDTTMQEFISTHLQPNSEKFGHSLPQSGLPLLVEYLKGLHKKDLVNEIKRLVDLRSQKTEKK
jgi:hypothetical protein